MTGSEWALGMTGTGLAGCLTFIWFHVKSGNKIALNALEKDREEVNAALKRDREEIEKEITRLEDKVKDIDAKNLTENKHSDLCKIKSLELKEHFSNEIDKLKDAVFEKLRGIEVMIQAK